MNVYFILLSIVWIIYSIIEGMREAYLNYNTSLSKTNMKVKMEIISMIQRSIVLGLLASVSLWIDISMTIPYLVSSIFIFIHVQNGTYFALMDKFIQNDPIISQEKEKPYIYLKNKIRKSFGLIGIFIQMIIPFLPR